MREHFTRPPSTSSTLRFFQPRFVSSSILLLAAALCGLLFLASCGGGSYSAPPPPPTLQSIKITPSDPTVFTGDAQRFTASGVYSDGSTQALSSVTWNSGTLSVASISKIGVATSLTTGSSQIGASSGGVSGSTTLTVAAPTFTTLNYLNAAPFSSGGTKPQGVVVADFNGDGKPDIAVSNFTENNVAVFLNDGSGNFGAPVITNVQLNASMGLNVGGLVVGDFNEDGKPDLVVATIAGSQVSIVLLGKGDGTFSQQPPIPNSFGFLRAKVADLNGDGHEDLVFGENGNLSVSLGKGDGTFSAAVELQSPSPPSEGQYFGVAVADFNGDNNLDIVASDFGAGISGKLVFYAGNGDGTFVAPTSVTLAAGPPVSLANADFDGDGSQDLLIGFPNSAIIYPGNGNGTFNFANPNFIYTSQFVGTTGGVSVIATDLQHIGKLDAISADFALGPLQITLNSALGQVPPANGVFSFALAPGISDLAVGDFNSDGVLDVAAINADTSQIIVITSKTQ